MAYLEVRGLKKSYGPVEVIGNLGFTVEKGEFISLLGPSGCGKTTTLHVLAGFIEPGGGEIELDGVRLNNVPSNKRETAMVFQNYALFPHMTVFQNVAFGLRMRRVASADIKRRVSQALELVQLNEHHERYPRELSGGQQQRVALARAVIVEPKLLLLDEPLSNLDAKLRKELRLEFKEIHKATGLTTIFVTHDLEEAFSLSDRVAILNKGNLEQFDHPAKIFSEPATDFIAQFLGFRNMLEGRLSRDAQGIAMQCGNLSVRVPVKDTNATFGRYAIPANAIVLSRQSIQADNCFPARLSTLQVLGPTIQFQADLKGLTLEGETRFQATLGEISADANVYVGWNSADMIALPLKS